MFKTKYGGLIIRVFCWSAFIIFVFLMGNPQVRKALVHLVVSHLEAAAPPKSPIIKSSTPQCPTKPEFTPTPQTPALCDAHPDKRFEFRGNILGLQIDVS